MRIRPLRYMPPLKDNLLRAWQTMPLLDGHAVSLFYTPPHRLEAYEKEWSAWLKATDRFLWPDWCERWGEEKKRKSRG